MKIFPVYAGVFLPKGTAQERIRGLPRICWGVSTIPSALYICHGSSPHMRGCFFGILTLLFAVIVFPAYAGVFLYSTCKNCHKLSIPRIRGGVSPRPPEPVERQGIPRIRGGVSRCIRRKTAQTQYSPHTRGCFLSVSRKSASTRYSPHVRGCVSFSVFFSSRGLGFQACAGVCPKFPPFWQSQPCFPACAEVCLSKPPIQLASTGLPRICVDDLWNLTEAYCSIVHPRIRGEYQCFIVCKRFYKSSPPHTRGILPKPAADRQV